MDFVWDRHIDGSNQECSKGQRGSGVPANVSSRNQTAAEMVRLSEMLQEETEALYIPDKEDQ